MPNLTFLGLDTFDVLEKYKTVLKGIGGDFVEVKDYDGIIDFVKKKLCHRQTNDNDCSRTFRNCHNELVQCGSPFLGRRGIDVGEKLDFGVAENSALWVTDDILGQRVSTFIPQYLAIIVNKKDIVATMHQAYERIGNQEYGFGTFIAGPSKTADIEQSLVLGAHGARGLTVFLME